MNPLLSVKSGGSFQPRASSQCAHRHASYGSQLRPPENRRGQSSGPVLYPNIVILYLCHGVKNVGKHCSSLQGMLTALPPWHPKSTLKEEEELRMDQWQTESLETHNFRPHVKGRVFINGSRGKVNKTRQDKPLLECFSFAFLKAFPV